MDKKDQSTVARGNSEVLTAPAVKELNLNRLSYFHAVAASGSLQEGARQLGLAPSTVSEQIRLLETSLGTKLFERTPNGLKLTNAGQRVAAQTQVMFQAAARIGNGHRPSLMPDVPKLDVGVISSVSHAFTSDLFLPLFEQRNLLVRLRHADDDVLIHRLRSLEIDLVVTDSVRNGSQTRGMKKRCVRRVPLVVLAEASVANALKNFPEGAEEHPFVHYSMETNLRWPIDQYLRTNGLGPRIMAEVDDVTLMAEITRRSKAWCIIPDVSVPREGPDGPPLKDVCRLDAENNIEIFALYMDSPVRELISQAVEALSQKGARS